jgi:hypothetical protein
MRRPSAVRLCRPRWLPPDPIAARHRAAYLLGCVRSPALREECGSAPAARRTCSRVGCDLPFVPDAKHTKTTGRPTDIVPHPFRVTPDFGDRVAAAQGTGRRVVKRGGLNNPTTADSQVVNSRLTVRTQLPAAYRSSAVLSQVSGREIGPGDFERFCVCRIRSRLGATSPRAAWSSELGRPTRSATEQQKGPRPKTRPFLFRCGDRI